MSDTVSIPNSDGNPLASVLVTTIRELSRARRQLEGVREAYFVAVSLVAERDQEVDRLRNQNLQFRVALRATSGRAPGEQWFEAEREALDDWQRNAAILSGEASAA